ncbi:MAG: hypothetical protein LBC74_03315 [Planctomycetaceae bacterium]|nr:hypothetical protein [Planctomycetaceae bacterium]
MPLLRHYSLIGIRCSKGNNGRMLISDCALVSLIPFTPLAKKLLLSVNSENYTNFVKFLRNYSVVLSGRCATLCSRLP